MVQWPWKLTFVWVPEDPNAETLWVTQPFCSLTCAQGNDKAVGTPESACMCWAALCRAAGFKNKAILVHVRGEARPGISTVGSSQLLERAKFPQGMKPKSRGSSKEPLRGPGLKCPAEASSCKWVHGRGMHEAEDLWRVLGYQNPAKTCNHLLGQRMPLRVFYFTESLSNSPPHRTAFVGCPRCSINSRKQRTFACCVGKAQSSEVKWKASKINKESKDLKVFFFHTCGTCVFSNI